MQRATQARGLGTLLYAVCKHAGLFVVIMTWTFTASVVQSADYVTVAASNPERLLLCLPLDEGKGFHLDFVNSIYHAPVRETFVYEPAAGITLVSVESPSAGVFEYYYLTADSSGRALVRRTVGEIRLRSHNYEHHQLTVGERTIELRRLAVNGKPLIIRAGADKECVDKTFLEVR